MTKSIKNPSPNPEPERQNSLKSLLNNLKPSAKKVTIGLAAIATVSVLGYAIVQYLVKNQLVPFLETEISNIIDRPVDLGEVKGFSLGSIEFGQTTIPPTASDPDNISLEGIEIDFNIFPIIFRRTLPADITLIQPEVYLEQSANGEWLNLEFLQSDPQTKDQNQELPFKLNLGVDLEDTKITLVSDRQSPIKVRIDGNARYNQTAAQLVAYDLDVTIEKATATVKGETLLETGQTKTKLLVTDLALADVTTLLPNSPVSLNSGVLNTDLEVDIPSFAEITSANITGLVSINDVAGEATALSAAIKAESELDFDGKNAQVKQTQASLGDIVAQVDGTVNLERGYDLDVNVLPFQISSLPTEITKQLPVAIGGEVAAALQLRGEIQEPLLTGRINNTQTITVDKTQFRNIQADFKVDFTEAVLDNLQITPVAGGTITADGIIITKLGEALQRKKGIDPSKMPLEFNFRSELPTQDLVTPYYQLPPEVTVGDLKAQGKVTGRINNLNALVNWQIPKAKTNAITENISGAGELLLVNNQLQLKNTKVRLENGIAEVKADANLDNKQWQADITANSLSLTPFLTQFKIPNLNLDRPIALQNADIKLNGKLDELAPHKVTGIANLKLNIDRGTVVVNSKLDSGIFSGNVNTNEIDLNRIVTNLPVAATVRSSRTSFSGELQQLLNFQENPNLSSLQVDVDADLNLAGGTVNAIADLNNNQFITNIDANNISSSALLNSFAPKNLAFLDLDNINAQIDVSGDINPLINNEVYLPLSVNRAAIQSEPLNLNAKGNLTLSNITTNLDVANTILDVNAKIDFDRLPVQQLMAFASEHNQLVADSVKLARSFPWCAFPPFEGKPCGGSLRRVAPLAEKVPISPTAWFYKLGEPQHSPRSFEDIIPRRRDKRVQTSAGSLVNIRGKAEFNGEFKGKNLISAPTAPGNISLTGDLRLLDFSFNNVDFDSVMTGIVNIQPESEIALNLQGQQDIIAASAVPCNEENCRLPYLPTNLEFRQGEDTSQPIIVTGNKNQNRFSLDINNFPLALLNLAPGQAAGIQGALTGNTTGDIDLNLDTLAANGQVTVENPGVGYIQADRLTAEFNYDPDNNVAEVTTASLDLVQSKFDVNAALDLQTGAIDGKLAIPEAYIQDILTTLRWFTVEDAILLFNSPDYASAAEVKPTDEINTAGKSIAIKLNKLIQVENTIRQIAGVTEKGGISTQLDIQGKYTGLITFDGTLEQPKVNLKIEGNNWQWQPQPKFYNIVESEDLVRKEDSEITIPQILITGNLQGTVVDLEIAKLQLENSTFSASGKLSPQEEDLNFQVADLTIDTISKFIELPVDIAGKIDVTGRLTGTPTKPQITGEVAFIDGTFDGNPLPEKFLGHFDYNGTRLKFNTSEPSSIQVAAIVPYPIVPGENDSLEAEVKLDTEAFALVDVVSQGYLKWNDGAGDANLKANARLDLERDIPIYDLDATGVINLDNAQINLETPFFSEPFQGTGKVTVNNQILTVESISGTFAEKDLSINGKLPILTTVNNLENPLTVNLTEGEINIKQLYKGGVAGNIRVTGAALQPVIGGEVTLEDGRVYIPKTETPKTNSDAAQVAQNPSRRDAATKATHDRNAPSSFVTTLNDFQVNLRDLVAQERPWYRFGVNGDLLLNGTVDQPNNIKPEGTITLEEGWVNFLSNEFLVNRSRENTIVFTPDTGILNPFVDIQLVAIINEFELADIRVADLGENEIRDPISQAQGRNSVVVNLIIDGETEAILPSFFNKNNYCEIRPNDSSLVESNPHYTEAELERLTDCFNDRALAEDKELLNLSTVKLTSIPSRSEEAIVSLMGEEFLAFGEKLKDSSQSELFNLGVNTFIINPLYRRALYTVDTQVIKFGKKIGLDYLHLLPDLEGVYEINKNSSIRTTYNYGVPNSQEVRLEYQLRF